MEAAIHSKSVPAASLTAADLAIHSADRLVLVSGTDKVSVTLSRNYLQEIPEELRDMPLLLTRVRLDLVKEELAAGPEEVSEKLGLKILGIIPENDEIFLQSETHEDIIHMKTQALRSFINIARRLQGENIPIDLRKA